MVGKKRRILAAVVLCLALLSGCAITPSEELYAVPKRSAEYNELQKAVESVIGSGGKYSAPVSGSNQQPVQQADLDGDGQEEVIVCATATGEKPLRLYIFKQIDGKFQLQSTIEGEGTAFESVEYAQIDGAPGMELIIGRQVSDQVLQAMSVYAVKNGQASELISTNYSAYTTIDLDSDGLTDIFLLREDSQEHKVAAELYRWQNTELAREPEAVLSAGMGSVKRIITGDMAQGVPAVFVASAYDEYNIITDVFAMAGGVFRNVSLSAESGRSTQTVRNYYVYSADIDGDGLVELPNTVALPPVAGDESSQNQYKILWFNLDVDGTRREKLCTYHNYSEGWYLILPEAWVNGLTVTRQIVDGGACTVLSVSDETGNAQEVLSIYVFAEDEAQKATEEGRLLLAQKGKNYYIAQPGTGRLGQALDETSLRQMFNWISTDGAE